MSAGGFVGGGAGGGFVEESHPRGPGGQFRDKPGGDDAGGGAPAAGGGAGPASRPAARPEHPGSPQPGDAADGTPRGKKSLARPGYHLASDAEKAALKVPPGYRGVIVAEDPTHKTPYIGWDWKNRPQGKYSAEHTAAALREKFERNHLFNAAVPALAHRLDHEVETGGKNAEEAHALRLIMHTGARVGSDAETGGDAKAYGASTLEVRHVIIEDGKATLDFPGKRGKQNLYEIVDPGVVADLQERKDRAKSDADRLFATNDAKLREHLKRATGEDFKVHDIRTWVATETAKAEIEAQGPPKTVEEYWSKWDRVAARAARQINDTVEVAMESYVNPSVLDDWRGRVGITETDKRPPEPKTPKPRKPKTMRAGRKDDEPNPNLNPPLAPLSERHARMAEFYETNRFDQRLSRDEVMNAPLGYTDVGED